MRFQLKPLVLALTLAAGYLPSLHAAEVNDIAAQLTHAQPATLNTINQQYSHALVAGTSAAALLEALQQQLTQTMSAESKANVYLSMAVIRWHQGDISQAQRALSHSLAAETNAQNLALAAALADATGDKTNAIKQYQQLLSMTTDAALQQQVALKIALLRGDQSALNVYAKQYPQQRLAVAAIMALQHQPKLASNLASDVATLNVSERLTLADWQLAAAQYQQAAQSAWTAYQQADNDADRRYALSLYIEAWRDAGDLHAAADGLANAKQAPLVTDVRLDLLLELGQYDAALALIDRLDTNGQTPALQARRASILALANRPKALQAEYQHQIAAQPQQLAGYDGLAAQYINQGQTDKAIAVYQQLAQHNPHNLPLLLQAAKRMIAMGLSDAAIALMRQHASDATAQLSLQQFLFETYLNKGDNDAAAKVLATLNQQLAPDSLQRLTLAENYERLLQPKKALACLVALEKQRGNLGYDQQLHLASLAYSTGDKAQALTRWQQLWQHTKLPARRNFLENRIVEVAKQLGSLEHMAATLARAIQADHASQQDVDLLVGLYLAQHQGDKAIAAVESFAKQHQLSDSARLQQLAAIYGHEQDYSQLNRVWRQLAELDRNNAAQYWQQITLNSLRNNVFEQQEPAKGMTPKQQRAEQVDALLKQLNQHGEQVDHQFAAGLYAIAGLSEQAIAEYQQALAEQPDNSDNLLQLVELLKQQQQIPQAASLLQLQLLSASSDGQFAAVDGLLNLFSAGEDGLPEQAQLYGEQVLQWLQRRLFENLVNQREPSRVLLSLADLGQQQGDFALSEQANRQLLAMSPNQRAAVLRAMISQYSGAAEPDVSSGPAIGDNAKKLQFGRRLLAMQQQFPPSLYSDLGKSLLADGDVLGAERAFSMMVDIPGIVNVKQQKGDAYADAGYDQRALTYFQQALVTEQNNLSLLLNTAILEQQLGETQVANHWYWQGLNTLLQKQSLQSDGQADAIFSDFHRYFDALAEGLLLTWPQDATQVKQLNHALTQLFTDTLTQTQPYIDNQTPLSALPRLHAVVELGQKVAAFDGDMSLAREFDNALLPLLANDSNLQQNRQNYWHYRGQPLQSVQLDAARWPLAALASAAKATDNFPLQLMLLIQHQDWPELRHVAEQVVAASHSNSLDPREQLLKSQYYFLMQQAYDHMPLATFTTALWPTLMQVDNAELVRFQLLRYKPQMFNAIQQQLGQPLLANQRIVDLLLTNFNAPLPYGLHATGSDTEFNHLLIKRLSSDELITFFGQLQQLYEQQKRQLPIQPMVQTALLQRPLTAAQQQSIEPQLLRSVLYAPNGKNSAAAIVASMLLLDVQPQNRDLLLKVAQQIVQQRPDTQQMLPFLQQYFADDLTAAYQTLMQLRQDVGRGLGYDFTQPLVRQYLSAQRQQAIATFMAQTQVSSADAVDFYQTIVANDDSPQQQLGYLQHLHQLQPDNPLFTSELLKALWQQQAYPAFCQVLQRWQQRTPSADNQRLLQFAQAVADAPQAAPVTSLSVDELVAWLNKSASNAVGISHLYGAVFQQYATVYPNDALVQQLKQRQGAQQVMTPQQASINLHRLAHLYAKAPQQAVAVLGTMWRNAMAGRKQFGSVNLSRDELLQFRFDLDGNSIGLVPVNTATELATSFAKPQPVDLLTVMAHLPEASQMFEAWLRALPDEQQQYQQRLYQLIIAGWQQQGVLATKISELWQQAATSPLSGHQLQLLASGLSAAKSPLTEPQLMQLTHASEQLLIMPVSLQMQLSRLFAGAGDSQTAAQLLQAAVWQLNYPPLTQASRMAAMQPDAANMQTVIDVLATWPDKTAATKALPQVLTTMMVGKDLDGASRMLWQSFVASAAAKVSGQGSLSLLKQQFPEVLVAAEQPSASVALQLSVSSVYLAAGEQAAAQTLLQGALSYQAPDQQWSHYDRDKAQLAVTLLGNIRGRIDDDIIMPWLMAYVDDADMSRLTALLETVANAKTKTSTLHGESWTSLLLLTAQRLRDNGQGAQAQQLLQQALRHKDSSPLLQQALNTLQNNH
ncbi:hypothetical protein HR45_00400 [Shewanella mangrovi]|uniref:Tetratricopeptide repeat protein n=1 Tax=Shewanella mangrovi TaxID=1515746 RepID=A0A094JIA3_9GAMM|nr:tetratricopeptide repeat protein [Shewanella mangrovi]KFZ38902.1 hypothetical protein HR45_00400 [Shewanella mangrovi]